MVKPGTSPEDGADDPFTLYSKQGPSERERQREQHQRQRGRRRGGMRQRLGVLC